MHWIAIVDYMYTWKGWTWFGRQYGYCRLKANEGEKCYFRIKLIIFKYSICWYAWVKSIQLLSFAREKKNHEVIGNIHNRTTERVLQMHSNAFATVFDANIFSCFGGGVMAWKTKHRMQASIPLIASVLVRARCEWNWIHSMQTHKALNSTIIQIVIIMLTVFRF